MSPEWVTSPKKRRFGDAGRLVLGVVAAMLSQMLVVSPATGQTVGSIAGRVLDAITGDPVTESEIRVAGSDQLSTTNPSGWFLIPAILPGEYSVEVRRMGYRPDTLRVRVQGNEMLMLDVALSPAPLDVAGAAGRGSAGSVSRTVTSGGVEVIEFDEHLPTGETAEALLRRVLGAQVFAGSGEPGAEASVRLRAPTTIAGSQQPLIVIDGVVGGGSLSGISAADVERINVYRGAAAAAEYGSRGQAGVIEITTRRGGD